jgi:ubiquinone/menaquinone biosynthesis C-methylase UbiE
MPIIRHHAHNRATMYGLARHATWYERTANRLAGPMYRRVVADVVTAGLPPGAIVLDVGTGPGIVPRLITAAAPELIVEGVDLSEEMIARATVAAGDAAPVRYRVADVASLPFEDGSVDLVVSSISLHHWADPGAGLHDIVRVLRPGAEAWIYDFRPALRRHERMTTGLRAEVRLESPLPGGSWVNPIGRLVLRRDS